MVKNDLATRMKGYEKVSANQLVKNMPVIIRLDGKAFHTFTKKMKKPFDEIFAYAMQNTMLYLCANIQNCVLGYTQSDEITLVLCDYLNPKSDAWFDYRVQKMCSVAASMATMAFNKEFIEQAELALQYYDEVAPAEEAVNFDYDVYRSKFYTAMFDARAFNIPVHEVANNLYWRQLDATRNSIQAVGQANFTHKELQGKSCDEIQEMLFSKKHINWNNIPVKFKRGCCCKKEMMELQTPDGKPFWRNKWVVDEKIPVFSQEWDYINTLVGGK